MVFCAAMDDKPGQSSFGRSGHKLKNRPARKQKRTQVELSSLRCCSCRVSRSTSSMYRVVRCTVVTHPANRSSGTACFVQLCSSTGRNRNKPAPVKDAVSKTHLKAGHPRTSSSPRRLLASADLEIVTVDLTPQNARLSLSSASAKKQFLRLASHPSQLSPNKAHLIQLRLALALIFAFIGTLATRARRSHVLPLETPSPRCIGGLEFPREALRVNPGVDFERLVLKGRANLGDQLGQLTQGQTLRATVDASCGRMGTWRSSDGSVVDCTAFANVHVPQGMP